MCGFMAMASHSNLSSTIRRPDGEGQAEKDLQDAHRFSQPVPRFPSLQALRSDARDHRGYLYSLQE